MFASPIKLFFFGLSFLICLTQSSYAQDKKEATKKDTKPNTEEPKVIFDSGLGKFDWQGGKTNYQKTEGNPRLKPLDQSVDLEKNCPVCNTKLPLMMVKSPSDSIDLDFCLHFVGDSEYQFEIWSCSVCGFSCHRNIYQQPLNNESKAFVRKYLTSTMHNEIKAKYKDLFSNLDKAPLKQTIIPVEAKVKNFADYIEHHNSMSAKWKGFFTLRGAYALRNEMVKAPAITSLNAPFLSINDKQNKSLKIEEKDIKNPLISYLLIIFLEQLIKESQDNPTKIAAHILLAQHNSRVGEPAALQENTSAALKLIGNNESLRDAKDFVNRLDSLHKLEQDLMKKAISHMVEAIEERDQYISNVGPVIYLIGELYRRTGDYKNAYIWLNASTNFFVQGSMIQTWIANSFKRPYMLNNEFKSLKNLDVLDDYVKVFKSNETKTSNESEEEEE